MYRLWVAEASSLSQAPRLEQGQGKVQHGTWVRVTTSGLFWEQGRQAGAS